MGNPIKYTELVDKPGVDAGFNELINHYKNLAKTAKATVKEIKNSTKDIIPTSKDAAEAISKQSTAFKTQKKVVDESQKAIKALTTAQNKLKTAQSNVGIETAKVRDVIARQNRLTKQEITLNRSKQGSMVRLSIELGKNRKRYRELSAAQRANVNIGGKLISTIKQQDASIKKLDASIGNNQRSVGNYGIALQGATRLLGALGLAGGIALVVRGMREMIGVFSGFEKQMAKVRAISGATDAEFALLTADAKRLGESTEKTASQVGELQLAFARVGLTTPQIIAATEATLDLSTAIDEDLALAAEVAAKTVKGFQLTAEETGRVTDVMALAISSSALTLIAFQDSMKTVAPVALAVNSTLESTTAILSTLVDAGLEASTAGTSLRNIFIELATQGLTWDEAMQQVRDSTNKVKTATELFGKRASTAALIIANNSEKIDTLTTSYENAAGSAKAMADIMRDTLTGDVDIATSALQGMVIEIGEKLTPILRSIVNGFTFFIRNIGAFIKVILVATSAIVSYRLAIKISTLLTNQSAKATAIKTLVEKVSAIGQKALRGALLLTAAAQALMTGNVKRATAAMRVFNTVTKLNPLGLLLGLLAAATAAFFAYRDSTDAATKAQDEFTGKHKDFLEQLAQEQAQLVTLFDAAITAKEGTEERSFAIEEINRLYGEYLPNLLTEASTLTEIAAAADIANKALLQNLAIKFRQAEITEANTRLIQAQSAAEKLVRAAISDAGGTITDQEVALRRFNDILKQSNETIQEITGPDGIRKLVIVGEVAVALEDLAKDFDLTTEEVESAIFKIIQAQKDASQSIAETKSFYDQFITALGLTRREVEKTTEAIGAGIDSQKQKEIDLDKLIQRLRLARAKNVEDELERVESVESTKFKTRTNALVKERDAFIKSLEKRQKDLIDAGGKETDEFKKIEEEKLIIIDLFKQIQLERLIEFERVKKEKRIAILLKDEKEINAIALKELELSLINQGVKEEEIGEQLLAKKIELLEKEIVLRKDIGADVLDQELELAKLRLKAEKDLQDDLKELRDFGIDAAVKAIQRKADAAIKAADEEIAAVDKRISAQEALAAQGLENSLKFEQEARAEALLAKLEAEKQKQRAEKISAFWNLLSNSDSVQEAIAKFGIGEGFARTIEALPAFEEGGETPDKESLIRVSEKGSEYIVKHGPAQDYLPQLKAMNEGTYNPSEYIDNARFTPHILPVNDMNIQLLTAEMRAVRDEIKNTVPRMESQFDSVTQSIINTYKWANRKKTTHYKLPSL